MKLPKWYLIDTNVPILANGTENPDWFNVADQCVDLLMQVTNQGGLVLDDDDRIFDEYRDNLRLAGAPGLGDMFMKWVHDNRWNPAFCRRVRVTCLDESNQIYEEFPDHPDLKGFDVDDRKFVAVANIEPGRPPIMQAVDFKWLGWQKALKESGVTVVFLDKSLAEQGYHNHSGQ